MRSVQKLANFLLRIRRSVALVGPVVLATAAKAVGAVRVVDQAKVEIGTEVAGAILVLRQASAPAPDLDLPTVVDHPLVMKEYVAAADVAAGLPE
tara:strand:- start:20357 stop:20641 length:285 start_codon:yes stop_codon:yes gene_type:complete